MQVRPSRRPKPGRRLCPAWTRRRSRRRAAGDQRRRGGASLRWPSTPGGKQEQDTCGPLSRSTTAWDSVGGVRARRLRADAGDGFAAAGRTVATAAALASKLPATLAAMSSGDLEQARADALVLLMLTNVQVATTVSLMIPVQTATVDEPDGSQEPDLVVRHLNHPDHSATAAGLPTLNPLVNYFGQPTPTPTHWSSRAGRRSPRWAIRSPASATSSRGSWTSSTPAISRVPLDEHAG
jgi:hypothetical protein